MGMGDPLVGIGDHLVGWVDPLVVVGDPLVGICNLHVKFDVGKIRLLHR